MMDTCYIDLTNRVIEYDREAREVAIELAMQCLQEDKRRDIALKCLVYYMSHDFFEKYKAKVIKLYVNSIDVPFAKDSVEGYVEGVLEAMIQLGEDKRRKTVEFLRLFDAMPIDELARFTTSGEVYALYAKRMETMFLEEKHCTANFDFIFVPKNSEEQNATEK